MVHVQLRRHTHLHVMHVCMYLYLRHSSGSPLSLFVVAGSWCFFPFYDIDGRVRTLPTDQRTNKPTTNCRPTSWRFKSRRAPHTQSTELTHTTCFCTPPTKIQLQPQRTFPIECPKCALALCQETTCLPWRNFACWGTQCRSSTQVATRSTTCALRVGFFPSI